MIKMVMAMRARGAAEDPARRLSRLPTSTGRPGRSSCLTEPGPGSQRRQPRRAGVSSFGISRHQRPPDPRGGAGSSPAPEKDEAKRPPLLPFALSAKSPEALREAAGARRPPRGQRAPTPLDVAHTLLTARAQLEHRALSSPPISAELLAGLDALAQGKPAERCTTARAADRAKAAFSSPARARSGSAWPRSCLKSRRSSPSRSRKCEEAFAPHLDSPLTELLRSEPTRMALAASSWSSPPSSP